MTDAATREAQERRLEKTWETPKGFAYWSDVNNTSVGIWYIVTAFAFMLFGGVLALIIRAQLAVPEAGLVSADTYNQVFTLHGTVMMFLFAVPIFEAVAILILPAMLGARDLPFPRLSAFGYWCFLIGGVFVCGSIFFGIAPDGGWFMYPPLATEQAGIGADIWLLGLSFIEVASIAAAVELIVGVLKCRAPGMHINLTPLYGWYVLVVGGMILFAFPPLIAGDLLFELERLLDWPFFDITRGGDPLLWQHLFWIFGHPEVYIIFLPAIALLAMIIPTFSGRPIVGYSWIVLSALGTGFLSFGLWVHHMFTTGLPSISLGFFSAASEAVAIPTGIQLFAFIGTVMLGRAQRSVPMIFCLGALATFVAGGLTGVMVAVAPFDFQVHDTYFIVAHLHYTLIGGMLFPTLAGVHYYFPFFSGRLLSRRLGIWSFWLMFTGFNVAFLPMHLTGLLGMPRRVFTYGADRGWSELNLVSTAGAFLFAAGFLVFVWNCLKSWKYGEDAGHNPWKAGTLEWLSPSLDIGMRSIPDISHRYPLWDDPDIVRRSLEAEGYLPDAEEGKRETLVTTVLDATPVQVLRVPGPSFVPMVAAVGLGGLFILSTFHFYWTALASGLLYLAAQIWWLWHGAAPIPEKTEKDVGNGLVLPLYRSGPQATGWWAMFITMTGDATAFLALVFGYFFFWTVHPEFPPEGSVTPGMFWPAAAGLLTALAWGLTLAARLRNAAGAVTTARFLLGLSVAATLAAAAAFALGPLTRGMDPTSHSYPAIVGALVLWVMAHLLAGAIMQGYCLARSLAGKMTPDYDADIWNVTLYWHFTLFAGLVTAAVIGFVPGAQ
ncbi:cytochrome c oxidase subunit I [Silicimonas algicola]|uniref:cytochrome-c oxidase n=1 Tax=Silicimonas algicola TaxID=1826607 RepID=A0A316G798_9RHOB|nr:cytochrome c oxidase subunit I [Silicimonas algicola]AZQ68479.1 cytochrome c oxidase subunit I [Silicimonas algicola]PWK55816.1 cytochrome c oxidase subunit I+III [Silicimonas algicola]